MSPQATTKMITTTTTTTRNNQNQLLGSLEHNFLSTSFLNSTRASVCKNQGLKPRSVPHLTFCQTLRDFEAIKLFLVSAKKLSRRKINRGQSFFHLFEKQIFLQRADLATQNNPSSVFKCDTVLKAVPNFFP